MAALIIVHPSYLMDFSFDYGIGSYVSTYQLYFFAALNVVPIFLFVSIVQCCSPFVSFAFPLLRLRLHFMRQLFFVAYYQVIQVSPASRLLLLCQLFKDRYRRSVFDPYQGYFPYFILRIFDKYLYFLPGPDAQLLVLQDKYFSYRHSGSLGTGQVLGSYFLTFLL